MPRVKTNQDVIDGRFVNTNADAGRDMQALREDFIEWLAVPPNRRDPKTMKAMAETLGVVERTLYFWRKDPRIVNAVRSKIRASVAINDLPDIVETLKEQAFNPDNPRSVQASKILLELIDRGAEDTHSVDLSDMSNEQLRELAAELHDEVDDRIDDKSA